jgi:hypothetical protein
MDGSDENVFGHLTEEFFRGNKRQRGVDVRKGRTQKSPKENRMNGKKKRKEMVISWRNTKLLETHGPLPATKDIFTTVRIGPPTCLLIAVIIKNFFKFQLLFGTCQSSLFENSRLARSRDVQTTH